MMGAKLHQLRAIRAIRSHWLSASVIVFKPRDYCSAAGDWVRGCLRQFLACARKPSFRTSPYQLFSIQLSPVCPCPAAGKGNGIAQSLRKIVLPVPGIGAVWVALSSALPWVTSLCS
jgi:hypothetical protein